jgi:hypothetical protein
MNLLLGTLTITVGSGILYVMPVFSSAATAALKLTPSQVGLANGLEIAALAIASIQVAVLGKRPGLIAMIASALVVAVGNMISGHLASGNQLILVRSLTGLLGEGPLLASSYLILAGTKRPERSFGIAVTAVAVCGALALQPNLQFSWMGPAASLLPYAVLPLPVAGLLIWMAPKTSEHDRAPPAARPEPRRWSLNSGDGRAVSMALAQGVWLAAPGVFWPFAADLAHQGGASHGVIGASVSLATIMGLTGSVVPIFAGKYLPSWAGVTLATLATGGSALLLPHMNTFVGLVFGFSVFLAGWNLAQVYQPAAVAQAHPGGRIVSILPAIQLVGMAIGSPLGGLVGAHLGLGAIAPLCVLFAVIGTPAFLFPARCADRRTPTDQPLQRTSME